jgi:hypothetical protein
LLSLPIQLFTIDVPEGGAPFDVSEDELEPTFDFPDLPSEDEDSDSDAEDEGRSAGKGKAVWQDPADDKTVISLQNNKRLRKLGRAKGEDRVNGGELSGKLREQ